MRKITKVALKPILLIFALMAPNAYSSEPLVAIDPVSYSFEGITAAGLEKLKELRDALRTRNRMFQNTFKNLEAIGHAAHVARSFKGNMFLYGPPGGAKSALVHWIFDSESEPAFQIQMNQMMTEQAFVGGQNFEKAKLGEFELNTNGSLANFKVALIDEAEKGNPAALAALLSLLNERKILAGNQVIEAQTETVFATSNSNLPEIKQHFVESGQRSTADAFLNRFHFKCFVYNWLSVADQASLDERRQKARFLTAILEMQPKAQKDEVFLKTPFVDWQALRLFANTLMVPSNLFMVTFREFVNEMRTETNKAVRSSEERHKQNRYTEPFVYHPSCDYTERIRQQVPEIVLMSAMIDFLLSDLADDENIELETSKQIELGPLSLWRSYLMLTTVGQGTVGLVKEKSQKVTAPKDGLAKDNNGQEIPAQKEGLAKDKDSQQAAEKDGENKDDDAQRIAIQFDIGIDESSARDEREQSLIRSLKDEQDRFRLLFAKKMTFLQERIKGTLPFVGNLQEFQDFLDNEMGSFELRILNK